MFGLTQDWPLRLHRIIDHAARHHPGREVVSRSVEGPTHRTTYAEVHGRALRLAQRLAREGVRPGDRVATLAWNTWRHLEAWFGISGVGAVYHTVNPRLFPDQVSWILNHAESRLVLADISGKGISAALLMASGAWWSWPMLCWRKASRRMMRW